MRVDGTPPAGAGGGVPTTRRGMLPATGSGVTYLHALRVAAVVLVLFGLLGFALLWAGVSAVSAVAADVGALQRSLDEQRRALATALQDTSRTVGDGSCTGAVESTATTLEQIITEVATTRVTERGATRADDRISEAGMEDRKREGYF